MVGIILVCEEGHTSAARMQGSCMLQCAAGGRGWDFYNGGCITGAWGVGGRGGSGSFMFVLELTGRVTASSPLIGVR